MQHGTFSALRMASLPLVVLGLIGSARHAQAQDAPWAELHGGIGLSSDMLQRSGGMDIGQPSMIHRASINATLTLFGQISLPFEAYVTSLGSGYSQPFNQFGIHPRFGDWLKLHAGYFTNHVSDLTFGDVRLLGGGAELTPGLLRATVLYGTALQARGPNTAAGFTGEYFRRMMGASVGYRDGANGASINLLYAIDDDQSITPDATTRPPAENAVLSMAFTANPLEPFTLNGELGISVYTADTRASLIDSTDVNSLVASLMSYNLSTTADLAGKINAAWTFSPDISLRAMASWTGPGFISLGYVQMLNDLLDVTVSPSLRLFDGQLYLTGSIGQRTNNLRNTRLNTTTQLIGSLNATVRASDQISVDISYANFGLKNDARNDTLRVSNISEYLSLSPRYTFDGLGGTNNLSAMVMIQRSEDVSQFLPAPINNDNLSLGLTHMLTFPSALNLITSVNRYRGNSNGTVTDVITASETASTPLFDNTLNVSGGLGFNIVQSAANATQFFVRASASYSFQQYGSFTLVLVTNRYDYAATGALSYSEFTGSLQYSVSI